MIMKMAFVFQFLFVAYIILPVHGTTATMDTSLVGSKGECKQHQKCSLCIQSLGCMWCSDKQLKQDSRCFANTSKPNCEHEHIENPQQRLETIPFERSTTQEIFRPKTNKFKLELRKGQKQNITISYTDKQNRPLDLYIVMDLSCTMEPHRDKVASLAQSLANNLKNLTSNLKIGFGSFVDKPLAPFGFLDKPQTCGDKQDTPIPYGFQNHLKLTETDSVTKFKDIVTSAPISSNIDSPEGTLDGLLQSVVCTQEIGWRGGERVRKLLVISTDGSYHIAGDGKLLGIVLPHDGQCYVDSKGKYTHDAILDYPSISLVRQSIRENDVFVIFAVTSGQKSNYEELSKQLDPFSVTQGIDNENSITKVIEDQYKNLLNKVNFLALNDYDSKYVSIKFYTKCPNEKDYKESDQCIGFSPGSTMTYIIEVELKECPSSPNRDLWQTNITVYPQSAREDEITIQLTMLCGCSCEREDVKNISESLECSDHGYLQCGICKCNDKWGGPVCNCTHNTADANELQNRCYNKETFEQCSGRGQCDICGKCVCNNKDKDGNPKTYVGTHCECENHCMAENTETVLCKEGTSRCRCKQGYEGSRCECSKEKCLDVNTKSICNLHGKCKCERCECDASYKGTYCGIQLPQARGSCEGIQKETEDCVKCLISPQNGYDKVFSEDTRTQLCREVCFKKQIRFEFTKNVVGSLKEEEKDTVCRGSGVDPNGCLIDFIIFGRVTSNSTILLAIESDKMLRADKCPKPPPLFEIGIGVASAMVLIGVLLLLIWKVVTHIQDKKEFAQFEKSINDASWNMQNPLYVATTSEFSNPAYTDLQETETET